MDYAMVKPTCPKCNRIIPSEDINVAKDVAYCRECNVASSLAQLTHRSELLSGFDLNLPAPGTWSRNDGSTKVIGATHFSIVNVLGALCLSVFWNGIVSVFVGLALSGTLQQFDIATPHWLPKNGPKDSPMSVGMIIFLWIFLTPFIAIGFTILATLFSSLFGRTEVRIDNNEGTVFVGIGPLGWRKRFNFRNIEEVRIEEMYSRNNSSKSNILIEFISGRPLRFGSMLKEQQKKFVAAAIYHASSIAK
jgi:hypothetical protein